MSTWESIRVGFFAMAIDLIVVDRQRLFREGLKAIMGRCSDLRIIAEAGDGVEALQLVKKHQPAIIMTGMRLPGLAGVDLICEVAKYSPGTKTIVVSSVSEEQTVIHAVRAGARGYMLKDCLAQDLLDCVSKVAKGGSYLCQTVADMLLDRIHSGNLETDHRPSKLESLTPRELQILRLIADGKQNKEIATALTLGDHTVRSYRKNMMKKLGINNVAGLTQLAMDAGLCSNGGANADD